MSSDLKCFLGDGPFPFPLEVFPKIIEVAFNSNMLVTLTNNAIDFPEPGAHAHESYEFMLPLTPMPVTWADKNKMTFEKSKLFPFNSGQHHGPTKGFSGCKFLEFQIENNYLNDLAYPIYGKKGIAFRNENCTCDPLLYNLLHLFLTEFKNKQAGYQLILESLTTQIAIIILRGLRSNLPVSPTQRSYFEKDNIRRAIDYLMANYNSEISLEDVANVANLSPYHFIRAFKAQTGKTPYDYFLEIKIARAQEMLKLLGKSITEICFDCGFNNPNHFTSVFKRKTGVTPSEYRKLTIS